MNKTIRIGTRKSALALAQTELVAEALKKAQPGIEIQIVTRQTQGDRILNKPLLEFGGKGVFVTEFEEALVEGEIDYAVHSAKDLPMDLMEGLGIVAVPKREDPRDVLVTVKGTDLSKKKDIVIGTSSLRRKLQIEEIGKTMWPSGTVLCENLRGNVQTRLSKLSEGKFDGILLAAAGLKRLGLIADKGYELHYFDCDIFVPAGGQGILAVEGRLDTGKEALAEKIQDEEAFLCLKLERRVLRFLEAGCQEPIGVYSKIREKEVELFGISNRHGNTKKVHLFGSVNKLEELAEAAARVLK